MLDRLGNRGVRALARADGKDGLRAFVPSDMSPAIEPLTLMLDWFVKLQMDAARRDYELADATCRCVVRTNVIETLRIVGAFGFVCRALIRSISRPLAETVSSGDLVSHMEPSGRDETSHRLVALKCVNDSLAGIVSGVRTSGKSIGAAIRQMPRLSNALAQSH